jgi:hypothetical protein
VREVCKEQHSAEWFAAKLGRVSASNIGPAMKRLTRVSGEKKKGDWTAAHDAYVRDIAWELITRVPTEHYVSKPMEIGTQYEGEARVEYWQMCGEEVEQTGFILHPTLDYLGCSPDGIRPIAKRGVEIKVPQLKTHEDYLMDNVVPEEYVAQMQCNMLCCELPAWDFVSYAPPELYEDFPEDLRIFVKTLKADPEMHAQMELAATSIMEEAVAMVNRLLERYPKLGKPLRSETTLVPVLERMVASYDHSKGFVENVDLEPGLVP